MTNRRIRATPADEQRLPPGYYNRHFLDEESAGRVYHLCRKALEKSDAHAQTAGLVRVGAYHANIHALYSRPGRLVRFWLRTVIGNHLVIVGNRDGLLPLNVESIHAQ